MKKIFVFLFLAILAVSFDTKQVSAEDSKLSTVSPDKVSEETRLKIESLQTQIIGLLKQLIVLQQERVSVLLEKPASVDKPASDTDKTPRIMYWYGKVNQHINANTGLWETDPDGVSGAGTYAQFGTEGYGDRKLEYCKKWYPDTVSVESYKSEKIDTWRDRGNVNLHTSIKMSDKCVQKAATTLPVSTAATPAAIPTPSSTEPTVPTSTSDTTEMRIMYWWGKVNQHRNVTTGEWETDPDGVSGANLSKLTYCKKWYPGTVSVEPYQLETISTWRDQGNVSAYTSTKMSDRCVQAAN